MTMDTFTKLTNWLLAQHAVFISYLDRMQLASSALVFGSMLRTMGERVCCPGIGERTDHSPRSAVSADAALECGYRYVKSRHTDRTGCNR